MSLDVQVQAFIKVLLAVILGGVVGLEREFANKPAGLRTHMLVAGASALFVVLGDTIVLHFESSLTGYASMADPIRIIQAIVVGISFLGAGTIIRLDREERVEGLTTAASILFMSAIGITVALDLMYLAVGATLLVLIINRGVGILSKVWIGKGKRSIKL